MEIEDLFGTVGLKLSISSNWEREIDSAGAGVYVISTKLKLKRCPFSKTLPEGFGVLEHELETALWVPDEKVIYIGQTTKQSIRKRVGQFRRHQYGNHSPHRGGQSVHLLETEFEVFWSKCDTPERIEALMLLAFVKEHGRMPFANRVFPPRKWYQKR
jgi:hypothetical protein